MLRNYILTTIRNLWKYKGYALLNTLGPTIGIACSLLIVLWITDESKCR